MTEPTLADMVRARKTREAAPFAGIGIALTAMWLTLDSKSEANAANIRQLEQVTIQVARMDTDIDYIKRGVSSLERTEREHHEKLLEQLQAMSEKLQYLKVKNSPDLPLTIKGMMRPPG
jgi:hypothetical protein